MRGPAMEPSRNFTETFYNTGAHIDPGRPVFFVRSARVAAVLSEPGQHLLPYLPCACDDGRHTGQGQTASESSCY